MQVDHGRFNGARVGSAVGSRSAQSNRKFRSAPRGLAPLLLAWLAAAAPAAAADPPLVPADYVEIQEGNLPIIVSAPHGGRLELPGVPVREGKGIKPGPAGFDLEGDNNTDRLAHALVAALEERLGRKPYAVFARFERKYIDANRPAEIAVESRRARPVYDLYHSTLRRFCDEARRAHALAVLLDIHGQRQEADTVFRGTNDGFTDRALVKRFGDKAHAGPESLAGLLAAHGINIVPVDRRPENRGLRGGFTVYTYGQREGIGAMQLEFGHAFRTPDAIRPTAAKVADAVAEFARRYLLAGRP